MQLLSSYLRTFIKKKVKAGIKLFLTIKKLIKITLSALKNYQ